MSCSDTALMYCNSTGAVFPAWLMNKLRIYFWARPRFKVPGYTFALYLKVWIVVYGASIGMQNKS